MDTSTMTRESFPIPSLPVKARVGFLSDLHVEDDATFAAFESGLAAVLREDADVVVVAGDLVERPDDEAWLARVHRALEQSGVPYLAVSGNHDVRIPGEDAVFRRHFGALPRVERVAGLTWLLFDSFGALPVEERDPAEHELFATQGHYGDGRVGEAQLAQMAALLRDDDGPRVAIVHHHLEDEPDAKVRPMLDADRFVEWCATHRVALVFVGHLHRTAPPSTRAGLTRLRVGKSTRAPYPAAIVDLAAGEYRVL